jgi:hypothetical protein
MATIRFLVGLFPAGFYVAALLILLRYPVSEKVHGEIREAIGAHERGEPFPDPITGHLVPPPVHQEVDEETGWFLDNFSRRELRGLRVEGAGALLRNVALSILVSFAATAGFVGVVAWTVRDLETQPGVLTVISVVSAGLSFTAFLFHLLRLRPAFRLRTHPVEDGILQEHLDFLETQTSRRREGGQRRAA